MYEPFGLSILEAAASGCALVLGDIPTLRENWSEAAFREYCDANINRNFHPWRIVTAPSIPHGDSGKIDRNAVDALMKDPPPPPAPPPVPKRKRAKKIPVL